MLVWEGFGDFEPSEVYKGTAIAFRPPRYRSQNIDDPINCHVQLVRPSTMEKSQSLPFQFIPSRECNFIENKKRKLNKWLSRNFGKFIN